MSQLGIKETLEILEAFKVLAQTAGKVLEDGKVNLKDLPVIFSLVKDLSALKQGVENADLALKEIKDLSQEESVQLIAKVYEVIASLKVKA